MSEVTLTFQRPEDDEALWDALDGSAWRGVVQAVDEHLRQQIKHGHLSSDAHAALDEARTQLHREIEAAGLRLWD